MLCAYQVLGIGLHPGIIENLLHSKPGPFVRQAGEDAPRTHAGKVARDLEVDLVFRQARAEEHAQAEVEDGFGFRGRGSAALGLELEDVSRDFDPV